MLGLFNQHVSFFRDFRNKFERFFSQNRYWGIFPRLSSRSWRVVRHYFLYDLISRIAVPEYYAKRANLLTFHHQPSSLDKLRRSHLLYQGWRSDEISPQWPHWKTHVQQLIRGFWLVDKIPSAAWRALIGWAIIWTLDRISRMLAGTEAHQLPARRRVHVLCVLGTSVWWSWFRVTSTPDSRPHLCPRAILVRIPMGWTCPCNHESWLGESRWSPPPSCPPPPPPARPWSRWC